MNLHLINDEKFFDPFVEKLEALNLLHNNLFIVKECGPLKFIRRKDLVYGRFCDQDLIGDVSKYKKVFIHYFSFEMYRWVHQHTFNELNWMVWGKELYESELVDFPLYESQTKSIVKKTKNTRLTLALYYRRAENFLMNVDVAKIYRKIDNVLTWIKPEYEYAIKNIKGLRAKHLEFAYVFEHDAEILSRKFNGKQLYENSNLGKLRCILGNSGAASNNHLDALNKMREIDFKEIIMPVSYGNQKYVLSLKVEVEKRYTANNITFLNKFMTFDEYLDFYNQYDVFISNSIRPVGMGNIWMALLMGKLVFMNNKNFVFPFLTSMGIHVYDINDIHNIDEITRRVDLDSNRKIATNFLSKTKIDELYTNLFNNDVFIN